MSVSELIGSRIMVPVGRWGKEGSSLRTECRSEGRTQAAEDAVSTPILFNPAAEADVSLLGGAADSEETFDRARSLMAACGLQSPQQTFFCLRISLML